MFRAKHGPGQDPEASARPVFLPSLAGLDSNFRQESKNRPRVFSSLHTLLSAQNLQAPHFQSLPRSLEPGRNVTPVFPVASELFLHSWAQERKSTPVFSDGCALFRGKAGWRELDLCYGLHRSPGKTPRPHVITTQLHSAKRSAILRRLLVSDSFLGGSQ